MSEIEWVSLGINFFIQVCHNHTYTYLQTNNDICIRTMVGSYSLHTFTIPGKVYQYQYVFELNSKIEKYDNINSDLAKLHTHHQEMT